MVLLKEFFEKVIFGRNQKTTKSMKNYQVGKELRGSNYKKTDKHAVDCSKAVCWGVK